MLNPKIKQYTKLCWQAVCGCFYRGKTPKNAEFAIALAVLDARSPRPIFARVQDGAGDRELRVFRGISVTKTPTNRRQAGCISSTSSVHLLTFICENGNILLPFEAYTVDMRLFTQRSW